MGSITTSGAVSGLDVNALVSGLVNAERVSREPLLDSRERVANARLSAFSAIKGALSSFQGFASALNSPNLYNQSTVSVSGDSITATAGLNAAVGEYAVEVSQLARTQSLASQAYTAIDSVVGEGSLTFRFGTTDYDAGSETYNSFVANPERTVQVVTIDSNNNSLQGIRDTVNAADIGVSASIVNDGTGYRLLFRSDQTGADNSVAVDVADLDTNNLDSTGLSALAFNDQANNLLQTVAAQDAAFTLNGLAITSDSNSVNDAVEGVSLTLNSVTTAAENLSVGQDDLGVRSAIVNLVNGYNSFVQVIEQYSAFDEEQQLGAILQGDATQRTVSNQVRQLLTSSITGISDNFTSLADLGITTTRGEAILEVDLAKLEKVVKANFDDIKGLFAANGTIADSRIQYINAGSKTAVGDYDINITQVASQGTYNGAGVLPDFSGGGSVTIDANNDTFTLNVNGTASGTITLTQGNYTTAEALITELEGRINSDSNLTSSGVTVSVNYDSVNNRFDIVSNRYGSDSTIEILTGDTSTAATLGFSAGVGTAGLDVAGTIGGVPATGVGQSLRGAEGSDTEGLQLLITGGVTGSRGTLSFTRGLSDQLNTWINRLLENDGALDSRTDSLQSQLDGIQEDRDRLALRLESLEQRYRREFTALDVALTELSNISSFLTQQLDSLPGGVFSRSGDS